VTELDLTETKTAFATSRERPLFDVLFAYRQFWRRRSINEDDRDNNMEEQKKQRPVHEVGLPFGGCLLRASIWRNEAETGPRFKVSFTRKYLEKDGKTWAWSDSFRRDDLLGIARIAELAHAWITANDGKEATDHE
jgi:hypothetical protein